jgi:KDO2-lipid IV(A) lauroyltransferase
LSWKVVAVNILSHLLRPGRFAGCFAVALSFLLKLAGPRRGVAAQNLGFVLPDEPPEKIKRLVNETYDHLVWVALECIMLQRDPAQVLDWVEPENASLLDGLVGEGAILLTSHVGNWEIVAAWLAQRGYKVTAIVRESKDDSERSLVEDMRRRVGVRCIAKTASMKGVASILKRGEFLGILPDQHDGGSGSVKVPLFGIDVQTAQGPAAFAYLTGKPIIPIFSRRLSPCRHKIRFAPPIEWEKLATRDETIMDVTRRVNEAVERIILESPGQWLAQHRRFRGMYS